MNYTADNIKIIHTAKVYEVLKAIEKRPLMWLTEKSITALDNFIRGYMTLAGYDEQIYYPGEPTYKEFTNWLFDKNFKEYNISLPLIKVFLQRANQDEEKAFELFFEELNLFKDERKMNSKNNN